MIHIPEAEKGYKRFSKQEATSRNSITSYQIFSTKRERTKKSPEKQASFELPAVKKQAKSSGESSSDGNSTGNKNTSVTAIVIAMTTMTTPFDAQLKHVLINYLRAAGSDHHIRKAFIHEDMLTF